MTTDARRRARLVLVTAIVVAVTAVVARLAHSSPAQFSISSRVECGFERWGVKTLTDTAARRVNYHPRRTTVSALRRFRPTGTYTRGRGVERTTYRVRARLVETKLEDDQDFHLVIADPRHPAWTMIVEFPDAACNRRAATKRRLQMQHARAAFINACGLPSPSSFRALRGTATITGVGFFDFYHGQTGVAPNAIELHPVLSFAATGCGGR